MASRDRHALIALYNATGGANWKCSTNWNTDADLSEWHGVEVHEDRVVKLSLNANKLEGNLDPSLQISRVALVRFSFLCFPGTDRKRSFREFYASFTGIDNVVFMVRVHVLHEVYA
ncbi:unnamed protein product [Scytosiphon promiscuus]